MSPGVFVVLPAVIVPKLLPLVEPVNVIALWFELSVILMIPDEFVVPDVMAPVVVMFPDEPANVIVLPALISPVVAVIFPVVVVNDVAEMAPDVVMAPDEPSNVILVLFPPDVLPNTVMIPDVVVNSCLPTVMALDEPSNVIVFVFVAEPFVT